MYEIHITTTLRHAVTAQVLADMYKWKTSQIERDPLLGDSTFFYLTQHANEEVNARGLCAGMSQALADKGVEVLRQKIEHIVFDTKTGLDAPMARHAYADRITFLDAMRMGKSHIVGPVAGDYELRTNRKLIQLTWRD